MTAPPRRRRHTRAFTLVELLVVIGIIAALIGILLPVLSGVQSRGRDIKCQSNLRQIVQLFITYAAENKGSLPYAWYPLNNWDINNPGPVQGDDFISWASIVSKMSRGKGGQIEDGLISSPFNAPFLKCPEAAMVQNQLVTYVVSLSMMPGPYDDEVTMGAAPPAYPTAKPAKVSNLFSHNILIHDTAVLPNSDENVGYLSNADVDGQRIWAGAITAQWRYYDPADVYASFPPGALGNNQPVRLNVGSNIYKNIDPAAAGFPYQGNLRFRHNKETACNVGYSDGHVGQIIGKFKKDKTLDSVGGIPRHDALRKYFMPKWPAGVNRDPNQP
jgi:prepilin-type N-terminal cleavage/methylation domain-containing protein/prepilin-type processing-associated H-X9-DG protein